MKMIRSKAAPLAALSRDVRKLRQHILRRDRWRCQSCGAMEAVCPLLLFQPNCSCHSRDWFRATASKLQLASLTSILPGDFTCPAYDKFLPGKQKTSIVTHSV
jgi:hypothetical protein